MGGIMVQGGGQANRVSGTTPPGPSGRTDGLDFYTGLPVQDSFARLSDPAIYAPVPDGWVLGLSDIVRSTRAIAAGRYKTVNTAAAAVIAAMTNALRQADFPFVFGGDGASFALPPEQAELARRTLAAVAAWVRDDLDLTLRVALVPVAAVREAGHDVRIARFAASPGRRLCDVLGRRPRLRGSADEGRRLRGRAGPARHPPRPDRPVLPLRRDRGRAGRHPVPHRAAGGPGRRRVPAARRRRSWRSRRTAPRSGRPVPAGGPPVRWPPSGFSVEATRPARPGQSRLAARLGARRAHARGLRDLPHRLQRRRLRPGALPPPARREHRFPQVRRRPAHDPRLHARPRRPDRGEARRGRCGRPRALRLPSPDGRPDDLLRALGAAPGPRAFRGRRRRRLCCGRVGGEGTAGGRRRGRREQGRER